MKLIVFLVSAMVSAACAAQAPAAPASDAAPQASAPVAGLRPYQRPEGAPRENAQPPAPEQMTRWLRGVSEPHPGNVDAIAATGHWWVPLRGPGLPPPYDLRGWHAAEIHAGATAAPITAASR